MTTHASFCTRIEWRNMQIRTQHIMKGPLPQSISFLQSLRQLSRHFRSASLLRGGRQHFATLESKRCFATPIVVAWRRRSPRALQRGRSYCGAPRCLRACPCPWHDKIHDLLFVRDGEDGILELHLRTREIEQPRNRARYGARETGQRTPHARYRAAFSVRAVCYTPSCVHECTLRECRDHCV